MPPGARCRMMARPAGGAAQRVYARGCGAGGKRHRFALEGRTACRRSRRPVRMVPRRRRGGRGSARRGASLDAGYLRRGGRERSGRGGSSCPSGSRARPARGSRRRPPRRGCDCAAPAPRGAFGRLGFSGAPLTFRRSSHFSLSLPFGAGDRGVRATPPGRRSADRTFSLSVPPGSACPVTAASPAGFEVQRRYVFRLRPRIWLYSYGAGRTRTCARRIMSPLL
jgi:hypothetical protein